MVRVARMSSSWKRDHLVPSCEGVAACTSPGLRRTVSPVHKCLLSATRADWRCGNGFAWQWQRVQCSAQSLTPFAQWQGCERQLANLAYTAAQIGHAIYPHKHTHLHIAPLSALNDRRQGRWLREPGKGCGHSLCPVSLHAEAAHPKLWLPVHSTLPHATPIRDIWQSSSQQAG